MSAGGRPSQAGKRQGVERAGTPAYEPGDYTAHRFPPPSQFSRASDASYPSK
jgi:hypothetical protein